MSEAKAEAIASAPMVTSIRINRSLDVAVTSYDSLIILPSFRSREPRAAGHARVTAIFWGFMPEEQPCSGE